MRAEELALKLKAVRSGRQWKCCCVAHEDSSPSMIIFDGREHVQVRCLAGCEPEDIIAVLRSRGLWDEATSMESTTDQERRSSRKQDEAKKKEHRMRVLARGIFDEAKPIPGSLAQIYFESRDDLYSVARMIDDIRYHHSCPRGNLVQPAVVIAMRSVTTNAVVAIQRIFLTRQGRKDGKGMMLGSAGGAAMKLQHLQDGTLHICEGLETGLSLLAMDYGPVWAVGSTANMQSFPALASVNKLTIWADHDDAGLKAAETCKQRWKATRKEVKVLKPMVSRRDANDVWSYRNAR
jgi:putative DNA primase/helicase